MDTNPLPRPPVPVNNRGCVRNLPEGCFATNFATWNVRTLNDDSKLDSIKFTNLLSEMNRFQIDLLGVSETHLDSDIPENFTEQGFTFIHSPRKDFIHRQGVATIVSERLSPYLINYNLISERVMSVTLKFETNPIVVFTVYAPDSSYDSNVIDEFYSLLQDSINSLPRTYDFMILGDLNAKVGKGANETWAEVVGQFTLGTQNENGEKLLQFCGLNRLVISNSVFKHKDCRLATWTSPNGKTKNQIDYILVKKNQMNTIKNCRVFNSADICSDHSLLMANVVIHAAPKRKRFAPRKHKFDIDKLSNEATRDNFKIQIGGRFQPLLELDSDIDQLYESFKNITNGTTLEVVGHKRHRNVENMPPNLTELCERRRKARLNFLNRPNSNSIKKTYADLNKAVKAGVKKLKTDNLTNKINKLEDDFRRNDSHNLFKTVRELEGIPKKSLSIIKDTKGDKQTDPDIVLNLWKEHFQSHLNTSFPRDESATESINVNNLDPGQFDPITTEEIKNALKKMKNKKSPGADQITTEVLRAGGESMVEMLKKIFNKIMEQVKTPTDFSKMIVTPVFKKGDKLLRENYRAIALLSIPGKVFLTILLKRMQENIDSRLRETQYGFRSGRGTVDAIFIVRQLIEKAKERNIPLSFHFIDFKAAFDTVWRKALWKMLRSIGVDQNIVAIIEDMYDRTECAIQIDGKLTEWFSVNVGVRQGCILSPTLFNVFLEFVMDEVKSIHNELDFDRTLSTDIRYADDTTLVALIFEKLKLSTAELDAACKKWGLKVNVKKCKVLTNENDSLNIDGENVERVDKFIFLGSVVPDVSDDVSRRLALATVAFGKLKKNIWSRNDLSYQIKSRLFYALVIPIAIYACETWSLKKKDMDKLSVFQNDCLRIMAGKRRIDRTRIRDLKRLLGVKMDILDMVKRRRMNWFGHVSRRDPNSSYVYKTYKREFDFQKRPRGRPPKRWNDLIREDTGLPLLTAERRAQNRGKWKELVSMKCARIPMD